MRQLFDSITYLAGDAEALATLPSQRAFAPFASETERFLTALSQRLRADDEAKAMPDVLAFAFWCRAANIALMRWEYAERIDDRLGRGVTLHFAPSNIPVLFAFSMAAGLLAGNCCAVRLPKKATPQAERICSAVRGVCENECPEFKPRIILFRYGHEPEITEALSALCDVRIIWGGDASVAEIRKAPLPPRATELSFADRGSVAVLDMRKILEADELDVTARAFYDDTYLNDQNACSSPRIIYWRGADKETKTAREKFWGAIHYYIKQRYDLAAVTAVQKWDAALRLAALIPNASISAPDNFITRIYVPELKEWMWEFTAPGGFFIETRGEKLDGLLPVMTRHCQTVCRYGVEKNELMQFMCGSRASGGDRIADFGHALDFALTWDGHDLIESMSRRIIKN